MFKQDPDDEDLPARPDLFIDNVLSGIEKAANKKADGGVVEVQHDDHHHHEHYHPVRFNSASRIKWKIFEFFIFCSTLILVVF